jgi:hypothetical protein
VRIPKESEVDLGTVRLERGRELRFRVLDRTRLPAAGVQMDLRHLRKGFFMDLGLTVRTVAANGTLIYDTCQDEPYRLGVHQAWETMRGEQFRPRSAEYEYRFDRPVVILRVRGDSGWIPMPEILRVACYSGAHPATAWNAYQSGDRARLTSLEAFRQNFGGGDYDRVQLAALPGDFIHAFAVTRETGLVEVAIRVAPEDGVIWKELDLRTGTHKSRAVFRLPDGVRGHALLLAIGGKSGPLAKPLRIAADRDGLFRSSPLRPGTYRYRARLYRLAAAEEITEHPFLLPFAGSFEVGPKMDARISLEAQQGGCLKLELAPERYTGDWQHAIQGLRIRPKGARAWQKIERSIQGTQPPTYDASLLWRGSGPIWVPAWIPQPLPAGRYEIAYEIEKGDETSRGEFMIQQGKSSVFWLR